MASHTQRAAGLLLHLTSLPGRGPIGSMGQEAREFVNFLQSAEQTVWQVLPLTSPARGNSPYSSLSVFAGNPYLISFWDLEEEGILPKGSCAKVGLEEMGGSQVDFAACQARLMPLLRLCYQSSRERLAREVEDFCREQSFWLEDYALFLALRERFEERSFLTWPRELLFREEEAMEAARRDCREEMDFWCFVQYIFFSQWRRLRAYANQRGVQIFGDVPIYVDVESVDVWAHPSLFQLDGNRAPTMVAGVPPDGFSAEGQLWGNPLYDWEEMSKTGYEWWIHRLGNASLMYDMVRIDHFRALESYWAIPLEAGSAKIGSWRKGPGMDFIHHIRKALPHCRLIAEDLGMLDDAVRELLEESGLPGLSVLLFAFDPGEESVYLPHNTRRDRVGYIGTHDNDTAMGWLSSASPQAADFARTYMHLTSQEGEHWGMIRTLYATVADTAIVQAQDLFGLGSEARMNIPSVKEGNWGWRLESGKLTTSLAERLNRMCRIYGRVSR